jgi:hypothetical protein
MYTLVTFLCLLSTYLLLRIMDGKGRRTVHWTAYTLANVVAIYTHFYAFFVLTFQFLFWLSWWALCSGGRVRQRWSTLVEGLLCQAAVAAAYLPWSGFVLRRYGADVSYWQGTLRIGEVLRKTLITFSTGHSVLEIIAQPMAIGYLLILLFALAVLALQAVRWQPPEEDPGAGSIPLMERRPWLTLLGLVLYLSLPCLLLVVISYQRAKFHPRYLMLSSPAFFLLIAGCLAALFQLAGRSAGHRRSAALVVGYVLVCYVGVTSGYAIYNAYFDIDFLKDDFRSAARFIEEHKGDNEVVILSSGHFFPVFAYYYQGDDWYPIPDEPTLSAEHVLGYGLADELNRILPGKDGVWVLLWQHEVVDPVGFLTMMLGDAGRLVPYEGGFWGLTLVHYALPPDLHFSSEPQPRHPVTVNFGDQIMLLGYSVSAGKATTSGLEVVLYWQALQQTSEDYKVSLRLRDETGHEWGGFDGRPTGPLYPTFRWSAGETLFGTALITPTIGTPPGVYQLQASLYSDANLVGLDVLDEQGTPTGTSATLGSVELSSERAVSLDQIRPSHSVEAQLAPGLELVGYDVSAVFAQPGDSLQLNLYWHANSSMAEDYVLLLQLYTEQGQVADVGISGPQVVDWVSGLGTSVAGKVYHLANVHYPTSSWRAGEVILGQYDYTVPLDVEPGQGELRAALLACMEGLVPIASMPAEGEVPEGEMVVAFQLATSEDRGLMACRVGEPAGHARITPLQIEATQRVFSPPEVQYRVEVDNLGGKVALYGYDLSAQVLRPGDTLYLTLYWQSLEPMDIPYTVFTHLLDVTNQVRGQMDGQPQGGARPTTGWVPQEYLRDEYQLVVQADAPPGDYVLEVGMYDASTPEFRRLPLLDAAGDFVDSRILLATRVRVEAQP